MFKCWQSLFSNDYSGYSDIKIIIRYHNNIWLNSAWFSSLFRNKERFYVNFTPDTSHGTHKITFRLEVQWTLIRSGLSYKKTPNSTFHAESLFSWSIRFCFESFLSSFCSDDDTLDDVSLFVFWLVGLVVTITT